MSSRTSRATVSASRGFRFSGAIGIYDTLFKCPYGLALVACAWLTVCGFGAYGGGTMPYRLLMA